LAAVTLFARLRLLLVAVLAAHPAAAADVRIVSLAPHLTALAFDAGAGAAVVGTVEYSEFPPAAQRIPRVGNAFQVDLERVVSLDPDYVLAWESGTPPRTIAQLEQVGLEVVEIGTYRIADVATAIRSIGSLAQTETVANAAAGEFERSLARFSAPRPARPIEVFIQVDDRPLYTVNGSHIISEMVERCGGRNVFEALEQLAPVVGVEAVIAAQPEVILSTDDSVPDPYGDWSRWPQIPAVAHHNVYAVPADLVTQASSRVLEGLELVCRDLAEARRHLADAG
jgi:iron complex transport system substrate-binding protein